MKLFQQLLVVPAALGLLAPFAANAADPNLSGVKQYASSEEQVTSINQFSDVNPSDWAFQALSRLIERYGCVAGYPDGTIRGERVMTRYEAAALLNACMDRMTEVTDDLKKLIKEFEKELAVIRGRIDGLEARVGELEATQFSTTTKLQGVATFVVGANSFRGNAQPNLFDTLTLFAIGGLPFTPSTLNYANTAKALDGATAFAYDLSLYFDTSFTGKDLLRTRLRAGNFGQSPWSGLNNPVGLNAMEIAFEENCGLDVDCGDVVTVNRLYYQFPLGRQFTATVGGRVRQDEMLAMWPSAYPTDTVLDVFTYAGAPGTYNLSLGAGGGLWWKSGAFSVSTSYVALNGDQGSPGEATSFGESCGPNSGGIGTSCSQSTFTGQIAYGRGNFGLAVAYSYAQRGAGLYGGNGTPLAVAASSFANSTNSVGVSGYWSPSAMSWIPSISAGWGISRYHLDEEDVFFSWIDGARSQSWYVGLQWADVFLKGNALGMAVGQPTFITSLKNDIPDNPTTGTARDGNYAWEWWYKFQVTDNITVTPAMYYLSAPLGQLQREGDSSLSNFGGLIKTTLRF